MDEHDERKSVMMNVLLDTSFFIRLINANDPLFKNANNYFKYFLERNMAMFISTISIAEFCVNGDIVDLPLDNLRMLPFNLKHAKRTGEFARAIFLNKGKLKLNDRNIIPNDTKLFAQACCEESIQYYLSSDIESMKIYAFLKQELSPGFQFINLNEPHTKFFGELF
jgi:predicted nucleic acid-binding protein